MKVPNEDVERVTTESPLCAFCVVSGGLEEGLLLGFQMGVMAATKPPVAACEAHRIRLAFVFELADRYEAEFRKPSAP